MKEIHQESSFAKDLKIIKKRKYPIIKMEEVLKLLICGEKLPLKHKDHALSGNWKGFRECHISDNWLLVYRLTESKIILIATGTHDDLFK